MSFPFLTRFFFFFLRTNFLHKPSVFGVDIRYTASLDVKYCVFPLVLEYRCVVLLADF